MKKLTMTMFCGIAASLTACATPPTVKMTLHIRDAETGGSLSNVEVKTQFRPDTNKRLITEIKQTDTNGVCVVEGPIDYISIACGIKKEGYYKPQVQLNFTGRNRLLNRWEPWNPTIEVKLRKKKTPGPMVHRERSKNPLKVPVYDQPIGYDLEEDAFVKPHGKGSRSDLFFEFKRDFKNSQNYDVSCKISFPNEHDGIQECFFPKKQFVFQWPYLAPTNNYKPELVWHSMRSNAKPVVHNFDEKQVNYIFRIRTQVDEKGNVVSACYGKIEGPFGLGWADWVNWVYWFNLDPNERSLEYSGENLLKK